MKTNKFRTILFAIVICSIAGLSIYNNSVDQSPATTEAVYTGTYGSINGITEQPTSESANSGAYDIPQFNGDPFAILNNNMPLFSEYSTVEYEMYSELDDLGRCGVAEANICPNLMPTEDRGEIGMIKPAGWHTIKYDCVDGKYLYNRCHLIGFQLAGENANEKNLITGTRYLNVVGMLPFENEIADYVHSTGNHVMYRVTPVYIGDNLLCDGVIMEALSVEDRGEGVCFNVFCYNVQPGVQINYATGESRAEQ